MLRRLLGCWFVLALCLGYTVTPPPDPLRLGWVYEVMRTPGLQVTTSWEECGYINAFYNPRDKHIRLCTELLTLDPGVIRFIYAHELAHAVIMQRDIPYTGSHEMAADELAAVTLILNGGYDDIKAAGRWWFSRGNDNPYWSDHPDDQERGYKLVCLAAGSKYDSGCFDTWNHAFRSWSRLLGYKLGD